MFMDTLTAIFTRRSTRHFDDRPIEDDKLRTILEAAMSGPSCVNSKDWPCDLYTSPIPRDCT